MYHAHGRIPKTMIVPTAVPTDMNAGCATSTSMSAHLPLQPVFISAYKSMQWPKIEHTSLKPLSYQPISSLGAVPILDGPESVPVHLHSLEGVGESSKDYGRVALALLYLGSGAGPVGADYCHNLVLPLTWDEDLSMGYGPVVLNSAAQYEASYAHSLVHRMEGPNVGEFGMIGWENANFWSNLAKSYDRKSTSTGDSSIQHDGCSVKALHAEIRKGVRILSENDDRCKTWFEEHVGCCDSHTDDEFWDPRVLHQLCAQVVSCGDKSIKLKEFSQKAALVELRILTFHCLRKAGYNVEVLTNSADSHNF